MKTRFNAQRCFSFLMLFVLLLSLGAIYAQQGNQDKAAALKQSLAENQKRLRQYQWIETTIVSLKGEEKSRIQKSCYYGADGKVQKQQISAPPQQESKGGLKGRIIEKKKQEMTDYMKQAVELVHQYVPPNPQAIQSAKDAGKLSMSPAGSNAMRLEFKDFVKPGDSLSINIALPGNSIQGVKVATYLESQKDAITLDARFSALDDGTSYMANATLMANAKNLQVVVENSGYRMIAPMVTAAPPTPPKPQQQQSQEFVDVGWPRERSNQGGTLIVNQPQVDEWKNHRELQARMAVSLTPKDGKMVVGVAYIHAETVVDTDAQMVQISNIEVTKIHFPSLDPDRTKQMDQLARTFLPQTLSISLPRFVACVPKSSSVPTAPVKNDPPAIFVSYDPAIMLFVDGVPAMGKIEKTKLEFVVNTSWPLFFDQSISKYYLLIDQQWLTAAKLEGPWTATTTLPKEMSVLAADPQWTDLKKVIPPPAAANAALPKVFYSKVPAEVILFDGKPVFSRIPETQLLYASNTSSNVFTDATTKKFYFLAAGRWFRADTLDGPWTFASSDLPADFAKIPYESPASRVLVSVPGTDEARDAVMMAQVPTVLTVDPKAAAAQAKVAYDGSPQFKPIEGTSLSYATNTQDKVIKVGDVYYLCLQGIWFMSTTAQGPWTTASSVPQVIYTIPPSSPVYNVTYVTQTTTSSGQVQSSYTGGYTGAFIMGVTVGVVVANNSGYYYPPYIYHPPYGYPIYHPYPMPYGVPYYNTASGAYGVAQTAYGPYGSATRAASYNPYTGTYARGASVSTPYGSRSAAQAYNPYTGTYAATAQGSSPTAQWGASTVSRGGQTAYTQHYTTAQGTAASAQTSSGGRVAGVNTAYGSTAAGKTSSGDMYAAHDGNVYKNTGSGWQSYDNSSGNWNSASSSAQQQAQSTQQQRSASGQTTASSAQQQRTGSGQPTASSAQASAQQRAASGQGAAARSGGGFNSQELNQEKQNRQRGAYQSERSQGGGWSGRSSGGFSGGGGGRR
jgi:hypothetical protein